MHDILIIPLPFVLLNLEKVQRKGKNTKIWISREQKELYRWNKKHFSVFEGLSFGEKLKIWWKIADTSFNHILHSPPNHTVTSHSNNIIQLTNLA